MTFDFSRSFRLPSPAELFKNFSPAPVQVAPPALPVVESPKLSAPVSQLKLTSLKTSPSLTSLNFVSTQLSSPVAPSASRLNLPARPVGAPSGSAFLESIKGLSGAQREQAFLSQILSGNVPDHLRQFKEISLSAKGADGQTHQAIVRTLPDYLAIGSNEDYALVPLTPLTAQKIADATGSSLPTRKLVNDIYRLAEVKLAPSPKKPGAEMMSTRYYAEHNQTIAQQRQQAGAQAGQLIAGHKKDVVISNRLDQKPGSVAIYGWHQPNGKAIQPLSTVHEDTYADYSHGIRLIAGSVRIDGQEYAIQDVLKDPQLAPLLSDEGAIKNPRVKLR